MKNLFMSVLVGLLGITSVARSFEIVVNRITDEDSLRGFLESRADYLHSLEIWAMHPGYEDGLVLEINGGVGS